MAFTKPERELPKTVKSLRPKKWAGAFGLYHNGECFIVTVQEAAAILERSRDAFLSYDFCDEEGARICRVPFSDESVRDGYDIRDLKKMARWMWLNHKYRTLVQLKRVFGRVDILMEYASSFEVSRRKKGKNRHRSAWI